MNKSIMKLLYAILFVVLIPALILYWQTRLDSYIDGLPVLQNNLLGIILLSAGFLIMFLGWFSLIKLGKGLPMNAFPPQYLVTNNIYGVFRHPIYVGFLISLCGYFLSVGSVSGIWIVLPIVTISCMALVMGYENWDLKERFGTHKWKTIIGFPDNTDEKPTVNNRLSVLILIFLPWIVLYELFIILGPLPNSINFYFNFESDIPVVEWTEIFYLLTYLFVLVVPFIVKRQNDLKQFMEMSLFAMALTFLSYLVFPFYATPKEFIPVGFFGELILFERSLDGAAAAFPSFHVIWAYLSAWIFARSFSLKFLWYTLATLIAISCVTTGAHPIIDAIAGIVYYYIIINYKTIWEKALAISEWFSNSWKEWRVGKVRIINHGFYVGFAGFIGVIIAGHIAGNELVPYVIFTSFVSLIGAGVWGQALEGSSKLARPFGFYGGLFGGTIGLIISILMGANGWILAGGFAVCGTFVQAIGRLRCFVQGCCHGSKCNPENGIVVNSDRSRVVYLANFKNVSIYPTPLYSIIYNLILGIILIRLWTLDTPFQIIIGLYLIIGGLGRFVEESYRGEPQTARFGGLAVYQWLAIFCGITGMVLMAFNPTYTMVTPVSGYSLYIYAAIFGLVVTFAMGVDFPHSNKRFSRLAQP